MNTTGSMITNPATQSRELKLIALRFAVRLEGVGMKSRGGSARLKACKMIGAKSNTKCADLLPLLDSAIKAERERI